MKLNRIRGTHDLFGEEIKNLIKLFMKSKIRPKNLDLMNLQPLYLKVLNFFLKPLGEQSDVVLKEMYTFKDRNE